VLALCFGGRHREQGEGGNLQLHECFRFADELVDRDAFDARHALDRFASAATFDHEHGVDQVGGAERMLAHETTRESIATHASHSGPGKFAWFERHGEARVFAVSFPLESRYARSCSRLDHGSLIDSPAEDASAGESVFPKPTAWPLLSQFGTRTTYDYDARVKGTHPLHLALEGQRPVFGLPRRGMGRAGVGRSNAVRVPDPGRGAG